MSIAYENAPATILDATAAIKSMRGFIGRDQLEVIGNNCRGEERQWFKDKLVEMAALVRSMPKTYEQDGKGDSAIVSLHYFTGGCDWWITERDMEPAQDQAFGFADIGYGAEQGYISITEIIDCGAEIDLHFTPCTVAELKAKQSSHFA